MKNILTFLFLFISISLFSQDEKRLALVIGNANYDKGELKNPVNDARLIASTLDSLDFDVILKENLESQTDFKRAILEFGKKRPEYDVAFVYYAGHGIQIDDVNYLLPTKEEFLSEDEVELFGVSVQDIMRYLRDKSDEVNILILDACRDNPFESNWDTTRSLKGSGLAKIPPPTGSLIAFSTDSGQTAPDGDGDNSVYTISLAKNMLLEDTSIDQVFRNVRAEVLAQTNGIQRPVEATQLTGQTFYLNAQDFTVYIDEILNIIETATEKWDDINIDMLYDALEIANKIIPYYSHPLVYDLLGDVYENLDQNDKAIENWIKALENSSDDFDNYFLYRLKTEHFRSNLDTVEKIIEFYVDLAVNKIGATNFDLNKNYLEKAEKYISIGIELQKKVKGETRNEFAYLQYSLYRFFPEYHEKLLNILDDLIERGIDEIFVRQLRGVLYYSYIAQSETLNSNEKYNNFKYTISPEEAYEKALPDFLKVVSHKEKKNETIFDVYNKIGIIYRDLYKNNEKAIEYFSKQIHNWGDELSYQVYKNRGFIYLSQGDYKNAFNDFNNSIKYAADFEIKKAYYSRIAFFMNTKDFNSAINDIQIVLSKNEDEPYPYYVLANIYNDDEFINKSKYKSLNYILLAITLLKRQFIDGNPKNGYISSTIRDMKYIYDYRKYDFPRGPSSFLDNSIKLYELYLLRSKIYHDLGQNKLACEDYETALKFVNEVTKDFKEIEKLFQEKCNN